MLPQQHPPLTQRDYLTQATATALCEQPGCMSASCQVRQPGCGCRWAYASTSWERISALAPAVLQAAQQGDESALAIQAAVVPALVDSVAAVVQQAQLGSAFDVVLAGELLTLFSRQVGGGSAPGPGGRWGVYRVWQAGGRVVLFSGRLMREALLPAEG